MPPISRPRLAGGMLTAARLEALTAEAEAAIARLVESYPDLAEPDLAGAEAALAVAVEGQVPRPDQFLRLHNFAHNLKGQGGSFGYPLVTRIAQSLCELVPDDIGRVPPPTAVPLIRAHLEALRLVLAQRLTGDGGPVGRGLAARLAELGAALPD
jgi:hypothetical protein